MYFTRPTVRKIRFGSYFTAAHSYTCELADKEYSYVVFLVNVFVRYTSTFINANENS